MSHQPDKRMTKKRPTSLILTDWGANGNVYKSPRKFVTDIIILSLLYDKVLIQDEIFVLSDSLPKWFNTPAKHVLLSKIFELDSVVLLAWPTIAYTKNITTDPKKHPLVARAEWHVRNSTRGDELFAPNELHNAFYEKVEDILSIRSSSIRERAFGTDIDVGTSYRKILHDVLSMKRYESWLRSLYPDISDTTRDAMLKYIDNPSLAVQELKDKGFQVNALIWDDAPIFNRSLGFQVSKMYKEKEKNALQQLIQSAYAIPLCDSEDAIGRYGRFLKEVPWCSSEKDAERNAQENKVVVEAVVNTKLWLPEWFDDFPSIINKVRSTKEGRALRRSVEELGNEITFNEITRRWQEVADILSSYCPQKSKCNAITTAVRIGSDITIGTVVDLLTPEGSSPLASMLGTGIGVAADHIYQLIKNDLHRQVVREELEKAVDFRCSWIPFKK